MTERIRSTASCLLCSLDQHLVFLIPWEENLLSMKPLSRSFSGDVAVDRRLPTRRSRIEPQTVVLLSPTGSDHYSVYKKMSSSSSSDTSTPQATQTHKHNTRSKTTNWCHGQPSTLFLVLCPPALFAPFALFAYIARESRGPGPGTWSREQRP